MTENRIEEVGEVIEKQKNTLLTVIASLAFVVVLLIVGTAGLLAYSVESMQEREAVSIALDDQRAQYRECLHQESLETCDSTPVSPSSRDIKRNLESAGFSEVLYMNYTEESGSEYEGDGSADHNDRRETFGLLGYIMYGN